MKLEYTTDICGNEILQDETGQHQVMMDWEKPYMEKCIEYLDPFGSVLEIGFGFGYSATKLCSYEKVTSYNVIECSPIVWAKFAEFKERIHKLRPELEVNLIKGRWEDVLVETGCFDSVFFDDYNGTMSMKTVNRFNIFLYHLISDSHTTTGSRISVYSACKIKPDANCLKTIMHEYDITIPKHCKYARGDKMYIPIITQIKDFDNELLKNKLLKPQMNAKMQAQIKKAKDHYEKPKNIYCNLLVIDNFYTNALATRKYILTQEFKVRGNYPGQRTISHANQHLKEMIQGYIQHFAGKITKWPMAEGDSSIYNGAYQFTTSRDRTWIHNDGWNNWAGVLYMTPNAPLSSGTGIFRFKDGTRTVDEAEARGNKEILDANSQDYTKWELVDKVGNVFNRLVLFNSKQYHASLDYFGTTKENGRLFQVFFFSTEK